MVTLLAVTLGGILTLIGQVLLELRERRARAQSRSSQLRSVCRLQQDSLWAYQNAVAFALQEGEWRAEFLHSRWHPSVDDYRFIAETVPTAIWGPYSAAVRSQTEMQTRGPANPSLLLITYLEAEIARQRLHRFSGIDTPFVHRLGKIVLTRAEIQAVLDSNHFEGRPWASNKEVQAVMVSFVAADESAHSK